MNHPDLPDHVISTYIDVPVQRVWDEITATDRVQRSLYNTILDCRLVPGSPLRYYSPDRTRVFIVGEVLAVDPPHRFSYSYRFTTWKSGGPTVVTWELREENGGCRVTITHSGWSPDHKEYAKTAGGWKEILALLKHELETGRLPLKTRIAFSVLNRLMFMLPRTTRTEYVDARGS